MRCQRLGWSVIVVSLICVGLVWPAAADLVPPPKRSPELTFKVTYDGKLRATVTLDKEVIKIGKLASSHLKLDFDDTVSRMHAVIESKPGEVTIIDLGSTTGTIVNKIKVNKAQLKDGDVIDIGKTRLELKIRER